MAAHTNGFAASLWPCVCPDLLHQIAHVVARAALQRLLAEQSEPAFHLVRPRRVCRREVQAVTRCRSKAERSGPPRACPPRDVGTATASVDSPRTAARSRGTNASEPGLRPVPIRGPLPDLAQPGAQAPTVRSLPSGRMQLAGALAGGRRTLAPPGGVSCRACPHEPPDLPASGAIIRALRTGCAAPVGQDRTRAAPPAVLRFQRWCRA